MFLAVSFKSFFFSYFFDRDRLIQQKKKLFLKCIINNQLLMIKLLKTDYSYNNMDIFISNNMFISAFTIY